MKNQSHLLKSQRFLPLFITQFFGAFNDNVFKNAFLIWFTYDVATKLDMDAQLMVTIASGLFVLPFFLFSALAGQIADKFEKSKIVRIIKVAEIVIMAFAFIGFYFENIYLLLLLVFLMGIHSTFFGPIKYSLLPETLKDNELVSGNALIEGGTFLAILLGTILGGVAIRSQNGIEIICAAVVFFAVIGYIASRFIPKTPISDSDLKIGLNIFSQTWKIIGFAKKENTVWLSIIGISWFWFIGLTFLSQFPIYTKNIINGDEFIVTLFLSIFSIGIGVGSVMCNKLLRGQINGKLVPLGSISISLGILFFCFASNLYQTPENIISLGEFFSSSFASYLIVLSLLIIAIFSGIYIVPLYAIMQHRSDNKYLSRIVAANNVLNALFMVASSFVIVSLIALQLTLIQIFLILGIFNIFVFCFIRKIVNQNLNRHV
ncbi:MAG: MFS transporter [Proteobacteria bacterium]|nr:MFS transporter [Pseudomonadota bacterium]NCA27648.1 MFS transporter [Pseudomonadota bacterium]